MEFAENIIGLKCRRAGSGPAPADARPEDYHYTVVACWVEPKTTAYPSQLMCALVADIHGGTNVMPFLELEFMDVE